MGGDPKVVEKPERSCLRPLLCAPFMQTRSGVLSGYDVRQVGMTVVEFGGGRTQPDAAIDPSVGLSLGDPWQALGQERGDVLALVHARNDADCRAGRASFLKTAVKWDQPEVVPDRWFRDELTACTEITPTLLTFAPWSK